jgi:hypothetical protein
MKLTLDTSDRCDAAIKLNWTFYQHGAISWAEAVYRDTYYRDKRDALPCPLTQSRDNVIAFETRGRR